MSLRPLLWVFSYTKPKYCTYFHLSHFFYVFNVRDSFLDRYPWGADIEKAGQRIGTGDFSLKFYLLPLNIILWLIYWSYLSVWLVLDNCATLYNRYVLEPVVDTKVRNFPEIIRENLWFRNLGYINLVFLLHLLDESTFNWWYVQDLLNPLVSYHRLNWSANFS